METFVNALSHIQSGEEAKREVIKNDTVITEYKGRLYQKSSSTGIRYPYTPSNTDIKAKDWILLSRNGDNRIINLSFNEVTPKMEEIIFKVINKFKHHGVEFVKEELGDSFKGGDYIISLGDKHKGEQSKMAYNIGRALQKEFDNIKGVFKISNRSRGWDLTFSEKEGLKLLKEWNKSVESGMHFEFAGLIINPKDKDITMTVNVG